MDLIVTAITIAALVCGVLGFAFGISALHKIESAMSRLDNLASAIGMYFPNRQDHVEPYEGRAVGQVIAKLREDFNASVTDFYRLRDALGIRIHTVPASQPSRVVELPKHLKPKP